MKGTQGGRERSSSAEYFSAEESSDGSISTESSSREGRSSIEPNSVRLKIVDAEVVLSDSRGGQHVVFVIEIATG